MLNWRVLTLTLAVCGMSAAEQAAAALPWRPVRGGILHGISGMALVAQTGATCDFLAVHDNKGDAEQGRLGLVRATGDHSPQYFPLPWPNDIPLPVDLESLTTVPDEGALTYMAATSRGTVYHLSLDTEHKTVSGLKTFELPDMPVGSNVEALALQTINRNVLIAWAHRGNTTEPAVLYWGLLDLKTYKITPQGQADFSVPWPVENVRHISDFKIDPAGVLYITAATDAGDDGPFQSAVYVAGAFNLQDQQINFQPSAALVPLYRFGHHKIEAIELVSGESGGVIVGTDDENLGSWIWGQCHGS
ncbi:MAG: hypothetical protein F6K19_16020 [Cyanothece sp. SIO1E1]|nr:hypothetical protein [Cyanothece sp. SIO1E1]